MFATAGFVHTERPTSWIDPLLSGFLATSCHVLRAIEVLPTTLRVLPKQHLYERKTRTLFGSDTWGFVPQATDIAMESSGIGMSAYPFPPSRGPSCTGLSGWPAWTRRRCRPKSMNC